VSCLPEHVNMPVTGALRVVFACLIVLLLVAFDLHRRLRPPPSRLLRSYVGACSVLAFLGMLCAIDLGATDHQLWTGIVAPISLAVFSLYAELWRCRRPPLAIALRSRMRPATHRRRSGPRRRT
jgi:hypothetical protein